MSWLLQGSGFGPCPGWSTPSGWPKAVLPCPRPPAVGSSFMPLGAAIMAAYHGSEQPSISCRRSFCVRFGHLAWRVFQSLPFFGIGEPLKQHCVALRVVLAVSGTQLVPEH